MDVNPYLNTKTLILGDINSGKTTLTGSVLKALCLQGHGNRTAVVDMAPTIPETLARQKGLPGVGGKIFCPEGESVLYLDGYFEAPRLSSATEAEAIEKARNNWKAINGLFHRLRDTSNRDILLINDISMYLQCGAADALIAWIAPISTVIANGYWGEKLGGGALTQWERAEMHRLRAYFEANGSILMPPFSNTFDALVSGKL